MSHHTFVLLGAVALTALIVFVACRVWADNRIHPQDVRDQAEDVWLVWDGAQLQRQTPADRAKQHEQLASW